MQKLCPINAQGELTGVFILSSSTITVTKHHWLQAMVSQTSPLVYASQTPDKTVYQHYLYYCIGLLINIIMCKSCRSCRQARRLPGWQERINIMLAVLWIVIIIQKRRSTKKIDAYKSKLESFPIIGLSFLFFRLPNKEG